MVKFRVLSRIAAGVVLVVAGVAGASPASAEVAGIDWTIRTSATDTSWNSVTYGNGLFVAVATTGSRNRVMTSPDGITWTTRTNPANNAWYSVTYGNGLFVAVGPGGAGNRVMTSPDGINWTLRSSAVDNDWYAVTYGNGLFVAVASSGPGNRVMTSPDGINWTIRTSAADISWESVTYGNGLFVAVAYTGTGNRVMTSGSVASGGAGAGGGARAVPQVVSVDLDLEAAELPASLSQSATIGSWYQLPASADVVGVGENAGKTFLGVATREDFPVAIAQRQVDNGWGAYETYDANGRLASVFIPAGKHLHLTATPRLHAIWSQ